MAVIVTKPFSDARIGNKSGVLVCEVSDVATGVLAKDACGLDEGSQHPDNQDLICDGWDAVCVAPRFWRVTFSFSIPGDGTSGNPLLKPTLIQWQTGITSELFDRDVYGTAIANSAGDPFDRPAEAGVPSLAFTCSRWEPAPFNVARAVSFLGTVNKSGATIAGIKIDEGQCLCRAIYPVGEYTQNIKSLQVVYEFELRRQGFDFRVLDQGMQGWNKGTSLFPAQKMDIFRKANTARNEPPSQVTQSIRFDGTGQPFNPKLYGAGMTADALGPNPTKLPSTVKVEKTPDAVFLTYSVYPRSDFSALGL